MERLNLSEKPAHSLQESAIHCARYANILHLVKDKVVLDIACGEGYGSALLMKAGAKRVVGVDISEESIEHAKKLFGEYNVEFIVSDANTISERYGEDFFDIVVSIETIEHINTPEVFLSAIKKTAKENAIFYITCPNDYWYYPNDEQSNPFHVRKYTFQEFTELSSGILGKNVQWAYGGSVFGFGTVSANNRGFEKIGSSWMEISNSENSINVLNTDIDAVSENNCSFFVGLWNAPETNFSNSTFPISMDAYSRMTEEFESNVSLVLREDQAENKKAISILKQDMKKLTMDLRKSNLLLSALKIENIALRTNISELQQQLARQIVMHDEVTNTKNNLELKNADLISLSEDLETKNSTLMERVSQMEIPYYRYLRLSALLPDVLKKMILKIVRLIRK
ncbi:Glycosyl transferase, family 2:Glycosyl transferase, group 1 [Citrobacter europaeus]|uniref:class I SAM-dependent methyltransferase n=1 Tax=Citrobacter europaeus TaxID=1914243 RepID=UPI000880F930|nr:class I SAM-dependent methyltransferase [Citrobacter europaeus]UBI14416.1 class I SAM-dependent methyltransferase [Citrobacter europaeus]CAD7562109.1 Glycosyl transferase, family 2:Glycosyl transferase, group 1 [Citrobacter europaeus]